tara:strand:+ start:179 stop:550 length:372 start_codon:yes stop_codon:yes gene_type:complete
LINHYQKNFFVNKGYFMTEILNLNQSNFSTIIHNEKKLILVDFWAEWCAPCKMLAPILEEISKDLEEKILICKVNLDENQDLASEFSIKSIPTLLLFENGKLKDTKVGLLSKMDLLNWIDQST